jgi:hypothetical protein
MGRTVVVLQPQFFPWRGVFEQIKLCDEFMFLDDVQFQKGGFVNRVQIKTAQGSQWLTVPVLRGGHLPPIREVEIDYRSAWREKHLKTLQAAYARAPFVRQMLAIVAEVYGERPATVAQLAIGGTQRCAAYLGLRPEVTFSSWTPVPGMQSQRLVELLAPRTTTYITGLGALNYLDEPLLAARGIEVRVMAYRRTPYAQLHGPFDPHVSILDTIANVGPEAAATLDSPTIPWREAIMSA